MESYEMKSEHLLSAQELAGLFRELAEQLETDLDAESPASTAIDIRGCNKLKLTVKRSGGLFQAKVKVKHHHAAEEGLAPGSEAEPGRPSYKSLKKRMKQTFKAIGESLAREALPEEGDVERFFQDSQLMVTYPDRGDEFYERYSEACEAFRAAYQEEELERVKEGHQLLAELKEECHERYK